jgi:hypothetical protein
LKVTGVFLLFVLAYEFAWLAYVDRLWYRRAMPLLHKTILVLGLYLTVSPALAVTPDALSVEDGFVNGKGLSFKTSLHFQTHFESARISREFVCRQSENPSLCSAEDKIILGREFDATYLQHAIVLDARIAFFEDAEFGISVPFVIQEQVSIAYAQGVGPGNSTLVTQLLQIPFHGPIRAGVGDLTFHFRVAPFHHDNGEVMPALVFDLAYTAPTAPVIRAGNTNVGAGLHQISFGVTSGYPVTARFEPYVGISSKLRYAQDPSLYIRGYNTQTLNDPGAELLLRAGLGFTPWEDVSGDFLEISVEGYARYSFEGREATMMFDAIGTSFCNLDGVPSGTLVGRCPITAYGFNPPGLPQNSNGITDVEARATFGGLFHARYRPFELFEFYLKAAFDYTTPYFLTYAVAGRDLDGNGFIESSSNEFSPVYAPELDDKGKRIKAMLTLGVLGQVGVTGRF